MSRGVDVSRYQGVINWNAVAADDIQFAIISTGDGVSATGNPLRLEQARGAQDAGIAVALYHYVRFGADPAHQAAHMASRWNEMVANGVLPNRYWIDVEDTETIPASGNSAYARVVWLQSLIANLGGLPLGIYTARWYWPDYMGNSTAFSYMPLWTAAYTSTEPPENGQPLMYGGWGRCEIWQWSSSGNVAGISGDVDMNVSEHDQAGGDEMGMTEAEREDYENTKANVGFLLDMAVRNGIWRDSLIGGEKVTGQEAYEWVRQRMAEDGVSFYLHDQELYAVKHEPDENGGIGGVSEAQVKQMISDTKLEP